MMLRWNRKKTHFPLIAILSLVFIVFTILYNERSIRQIQENPDHVHHHQEAPVTFVKANRINPAQEVLDRFSKCNSTRDYSGRKIAWVDRNAGQRRRVASERCDVASGKWVFDNSSYPLYKESECPYMSDQLACHRHGRPDLGYQYWRWQPHGCNLKRWNVIEMWEKLRGKRLMFVGDSLNRGQWISMVCLLPKNPSQIIIATGFIASTPQNIPTTLKRDGSDFSAAIMGALCRAGQVTIWTDVDGVYSADPRKVNEAVILRTLSYQEAWEMSYFGANVLHPRTIIPVMRYNIPIIIRNIFNLSAPGTKICHPLVSDKEENQTVESLVKGFATIDNLALVNVEGTGMAGVPGTANAIFGAVKDVGANVIMISQASSEHSVCFAVPEKEVKAVAEALKSRFRQALDAGRLSQVAIIPNCSILAAVGQKMASTPGVSATLFSALAKANINVRAIAQGCSEFNITVVVKREDCIKALKAVHSRFYLSRTTIAVGIIGPGLIGSTLLEQLKDQAAVLKEEFNIDLRVMGITGSRTMLLSESGIDLSSWKELQKEKGEAADLQKFVQHVHGNHFIPNTVLVDCTADSAIASHYYDWLRKGIHVITPNKKANSGPLDQYLKLRALQRQSYTHYFYEATVGAGLPIISTLRGLLETGDKILQIEGIFSGTLSYIFNNFMGKVAFSEVVTKAKQAGFTEPDPRDDLSGADVRRKVIILARESGLKLELSDIPEKSLVPEPLRASASAEEFMQKLPQFDQEMSKKLQDAEDAGEVLRYVGVVDVVKQKGVVELRRYKKDHPFAQLSGSDNIIAFTTTRYQKQPLIVRGPGAGAQVTAGGIFSDILRLASYLGAPS